MQGLVAEGLVESIYEAACDHARWPYTLDAIAKANDSICATHFSWRKDTESLGFFLASRDYSGNSEYAAHFSRLDPRRPLTQRLHEGGILRCHEHLDDSYVAKSPFYQDFSLKHDRRFLMSVHLINTDQVSSFLVLHRTRTQGPFVDQDFRSFEALTPHLRRAAQVHMRIEQIEAAHRRASAALDQLPFGVLTVDPQGRVLSANSAAAETLQSGDGLAIRNGRLAAHVHSSAELMAEALRRATMFDPGTERHGSSHIVQRPSGRPGYRVLVTPLGENGPTWVPKGSEVSALVLITDPERIPAPTEDHLRRMFGMTRSEAQVALGLAEGKTINEIAEERNARLGTVRVQLKCLLQKTDTHRQSSLIQLLLTIPAIAHRRSEAG
jgi:PAS domain-containing protein/DNA-binding CsgD family transcriptional regulator